MRRLLATLGVAAAALLLSGHVGSPNVFFDGSAGPYPVRVVIRPPDVIPGQAEISVRVAGAERVGVRPVRWDLGLEGAPRPDPALPVGGEPGLWSARLWLMDFGSYSVHVEVEGPRGAGTVIVPVPAVATRVKEMPAALGIPLVGLGIFLTAGLVTLVGAAVREAVLPPGERPDEARLRRARRAKLAALPLFALALLGGSRWWSAEDGTYRRNVYRNPSVAGTVAAEGADQILTLRLGEVSDAGRRVGLFASAATPLLPDHGKLMHLFLVRQPGLGAFAHLHPERVDPATFRVRLPPLPAGEYRLYGDILHESGFPQTLVDTVTIPAAPASRPADPDDSWTTAAPARGTSLPLADGSTLHWDRPARPRAGRETTLRFRVTDPAGGPAALEPYMGMMAHAAVTRDDGSVFVHLHPGGTVSMTAVRRFEALARGDAAAPAETAHAAHAPEAATIEIPYEFPRPGTYGVWVQVKRDGRVLTGAFVTEVE